MRDFIPGGRNLGPLDYRTGEQHPFRCAIAADSDIGQTDVATLTVVLLASGPSTR